SLSSSLFVLKGEAQWGGKGSAMVIDTMALKYLPLAVGNVYKYHYSSSTFYSYDYKVRIVKDTIINSKRYFVLNQLFPGSIGQVLRCDSTSGNVYQRGDWGYCAYSPFEVLIDSLRSRKWDSTLVCTPSVPKHYCADTSYATLFGIQMKKKTFTRYTSAVSTSITYGMNFGIIFSTYSDMWGMAGESLVGCYINGVLYGDTTLSDIENISTEIPTKYSLGQNYPNPFNPITNVKFSIVKTGDVSLKVYDVQGREVQTLVNEKLNAGTYEVKFDGSMLTSGVYFYKMVSEGYSETKRMLLIK
ncbi:MAG: T9SS type A sorting domain-containing protein, partial [Ignavibacteria bacterium]